MSRALVMGASGFLGSHVVKQLAASGQDVRVMVRASSDTRAIDHLQVERVIGDVNDSTAVASAMADCDTVYYCIVDTRAWLRDPAPLYRTNVDGLRKVLDVALETPVRRFVFTSTFATIGRNPSGVSTEEDAFNWWDQAPDYVRCRVQAEDMFLEYCRDRGLPGVACCVGNTYGPGDYAPTPHGKLIADAASGRMPVYWEGGGPSVGIEDAARAMVLAARHGRVGERYIIAERWADFIELFTLAARAAGIKPPSIKVPRAVLFAGAAVADLVSAITRQDNRFSIASLRCATLLPNVSSDRARRELHWEPQPLEESVKAAVAFYRDELHG